VSIILNIDTAVEISSICIAENEVPIGVKINPSQKESAAWLHTAIKELIDEKNISLQQLNAIAVTEGPGSYTGLRVGMSTAKGLCYVLNKPLITVNTLKLLAFVARKAHGELLCPMIDARRMEVFAAVLDKELNFVQAPTNLILNESSFIEWLSKESIVFFGNGSVKFQEIMKHPNALFASIEANATSMVSLSYEKFLLREFADLAYAQPFYGKDFHSSIKQSL